MPLLTKRANKQIQSEQLTICLFLVIECGCRVVKEEIVDDSTVLPVFSGRVISWVCCTPQKKNENEIANNSRE